MWGYISGWFNLHAKHFLIISFCSPRFSHFVQNLNMVLHQTPFFLSFLAMFIAFFCHCSATKFTVGDSAGWIIPPYPTYYNNWTHSHFIRAGDSIGKKAQ